MVRAYQKEAQSLRGGNSRSRVESSEEDPDPSSTDLVVNHITMGVLAARYVPGQRLIEADLTHALRVSRGPVREAFRRLDALGILSRAMHRGACIRTLTRTEAVDLLVASEPLTCLMGRLAAEEFKSRKTVRDIGSFEAELRPFCDLKQDLSHEPGRRQHFYDILAAMTGNSQLPSLFPTMRIHLLRLQTQSYRDVADRRANMDDFAAIAKAVLDGNGKTAEKACLVHNRRMRRAIENMPDEAFPRIDVA
jgi:DNA-binding GntR family transcriptional regulator